MQFFDFEWEGKQDIIKSMLLNALGKSEMVNARKLTVERIDHADAKRFLDDNHLAGYRAAKTSIALLRHNEILMVASFSKYRDGFELIRLATKQGYNIRGGLSRLLAHFKKNNDQPLFTYADFRYSYGHSYRHLGFRDAGLTRPGYFYYRGNAILSRQQCQKSKLAKLLGEGFDPTLSESANMFRNGFRRVSDAGHLRFTT
jgi:hypothetical protein